jgi:cell division protein FtsB
MRKKDKGKLFTGLFLTPYFFTLGCLVVLAAIIVPVYNNARQRLDVNNQISDLQRQIASLESSNADLTKLETFLQSDQFAEQEARMDLGLKKPGENVAVIENPDQAPTADNPYSAGDNSEKNSNPVNWWNYFFGN